MIKRLLNEVTDNGSRTDLQIVVVCNGCTDDTAGAARQSAPHAQVVELDKPSKFAALRAGDASATAFPRVYVDADVDIDYRSLAALIDALTTGVLAVGPRRVLRTESSSLIVRAYYEVWRRLPAVSNGLFGRGVVAVSQEGWERVASMPELMSDDLAISEAFRPEERAIVATALVTIRLPRTTRDLVRRRVRVVTGNRQADQKAIRGREANTTRSQLIRMLRHEPSVVARMPVFLAVTLLARVLAWRRVRHGDFTTWERDESSRL